MPNLLHQFDFWRNWLVHEAWYAIRDRGLEFESWLVRLFSTIAARSLPRLRHAARLIKTAHEWGCWYMWNAQPSPSVWIFGATGWCVKPNTYYYNA